MHRSVSFSLVIALLWLLLIGGYLLTVPLQLPDVEFSRLALTVIFPEWWDEYWGREPASLDQFLLERIDLWFTALIGGLGIWAVGRITLRCPYLRAWSGMLATLDFNLFAYGMGLSLITTSLLLLGLVGCLSSLLFRILILIPVLLELMHWYRHRQAGSIKPARLPFRAHLGLLLCMIPFLLVMIFGATQPPIDFDVREYHLEGPKEYYLAGQITFLEHNVYTSFPALTEMVSLLGMLLRGDWYRGALVGKCLLMPLVPLTGLALGSIARKLFNETSGWLTCLVWLSIPWAHTLATVAYVEGGMLFYLALTFLLAIQLLQSRSVKRDSTDTLISSAPVFLLGLFVGAAMACKYPGLVWGVIPAVVLLISLLIEQQRELKLPPLSKQLRRGSGLFLLGLLISVGPWLFKNLIFTGNPVFPLAYGLFGGRGWTPELYSAWQAAHAVPKETLAALPEALYVRLVTDPRQTPLLLMFAPLLFLRKESRATGFALFVLLFYLTLIWWFLTHRIDRFWLPALLPLTLMVGGGFVWSDSIYWPRFNRVGAFLVMGVTFTLMISSLGTFLPVGNRMELTRQFAEQQAYLIHVLNEELPEETRVLLIGEAQVFDAQFEPVYNTVFNRSQYLQLVATSEVTGELKPTDQIKAAFAEAEIVSVAVNWEEVLRYRGTYGFNEHIVPAHLQQLVEREVLSSPKALWRVKLAELASEKQAEIKKWAPELIETLEGEVYVVLAQLYQVR
ncbi:MAG: hypothetical protein KDA65_08365 [Planctomycetaceae bacterium]|nr:hypothetical protein [Planctomycetaceae bacterium]